MTLATPAASNYSSNTPHTLTSPHYSPQPPSFSSLCPSNNTSTDTIETNDTDTPMMCASRMRWSSCSWGTFGACHAKFGQQESELVNIGTIMNVGGQLVNGHSTPPHTVGKSCTMKHVLTGYMWSVPCQVWAVRSELVNIGTIMNAAHTMGKLHAMKLMLTGRMWSVPRQVWAARSELVNIGMITNALSFGLLSRDANIIISLL